MKASDKILFIANPTARRGKALLEIPKIYEVYGENFEYEIITTIRPGHAIEIARDVHTFKTIVAVGGDGTVHEVINGIMQRPEDDRPAFSIIPAGSGNDYANALGITNNTRKALIDLLNNTPRRVDLGLCNNEWFCDSFALGIDARIAQGTTELKGSSPFSGQLLYIHSLINTFVKDFNTIKACVSLDGAPAEETEFLLFATTKGPTYGGGFKITPTSRPDNGHFETCSISSLSRLGALWRLAFLAFGKHTHLSGVSMNTPTELTIESSELMCGALDGEPRQSTRFDVSLVPNALDII